MHDVLRGRCRYFKYAVRLRGLFRLKGTDQSRLCMPMVLEVARLFSLLTF